MALPPNDAERGTPAQDWTRFRDGDPVNLVVVVLDLGGSSELTDELGPAVAHEVKEGFRARVDDAADEFGAYPKRDHVGDATALLFFRSADAFGAVIRILESTARYRAKLADGVLDDVAPSVARGFRLAAASGEIVFHSAPGRCTGAPLDLAGHMLKICDAPGFVVTRGFYDEQLLASQRRLFDPDGPAVRHSGRPVPTAMFKLRHNGVGASVRDKPVVMDAITPGLCFRDGTLRAIVDASGVADALWGLRLDGSGAAADTVRAIGRVPDIRDALRDTIGWERLHFVVPIAADVDPDGEALRGVLRAHADLRGSLVLDIAPEAAPGAAGAWRLLAETFGVRLALDAGASHVVLCSALASTVALWRRSGAVTRSWLDRRCTLDTITSDLQRSRLNAAPILVEGVDSAREHDLLRRVTPEARLLMTGAAVAVPPPWSNVLARMGDAA